MIGKDNAIRNTIFMIRMKKNLVRSENYEDKEKRKWSTLDLRG